MKRQRPRCGPELADYLDRRIRLGLARHFIAQTGVVFMADPTPFPLMHLFPRLHRLLRRPRQALNRWRYLR